jgi:ferric iron reductase protein FhuF
MQKLPDINALMPIGGIVNEQSLKDNPFYLMRYMQMMENSQGNKVAEEMMNTYMMKTLLNGMSNGDSNPFNALFGRGVVD